MDSVVLSKDILVVELIIEGLFIRWSTVEIEELEAQEPEGDELHVEVEGHEEVEQLHIWWNVDQCERKQKDDLKWPDHTPELVHQKGTIAGVSFHFDLTRGIEGSGSHSR